MTDPYFAAKTIDDLMREVVDKIFSNGKRIETSRGWATELTGVLLELSNPRARLSRTETRGKSLSCLGKLCWYLAKTNDRRFISYYLPEYYKSADGNEIFDGYGPRLFGWKGQDQVANVIDLLKTKSCSRRAVIQLFDAGDLAEEHNDVPCTCTLQFMIRENELSMFTNMRSNDVYWGLPHDIFSFTMLQEIVARKLSVEIGTYKHAVGSLHLYDSKCGAAQQFLDEGWQSTEMAMPSMPTGDPWPGIESLLKAESGLRERCQLDEASLNDLNPYWADLVRLLQVFRHYKDKNVEEIRALCERMFSDFYRPFIDMKLSQLQ